MGNPLEDFLFGRYNPQTGETDGGIPAVADTLWPFEGHAVSTALDSTAGRVVTFPARGALAVGMAGLTALDIAFEYGMYRPLSTAIQAGATPSTEAMKRGAPAHPLYRDGIQVQDFIDMWNASEYISPGRALVQHTWHSGGYPGREITNPSIDPAAYRLIQALNNPYPTAGGVSREQYEEAWDGSILGTVVSGSLDAGLGLVGIPGVGKVVTKAKDAAGLRSTVQSTRDLTKLRTTMEGHEAWRRSDGKQGRWNVSGQYVEELAKETDIDRIISNPMLDRWTRSGSFNRDTLARLIAETDDVPTIRELMLADRGDTLALGRLFQAAPDHVWSLTDMNEKMARQFAEGGQYFPSQDVSRVLSTTFDTAVQRDEWWSTVRDTFMSGRINEPLVAPENVAKEIAALQAERDILTKMVPDETGLINQLGPDGVAARLDEIDNQLSALQSSLTQEPGLLNAVRGEGSDFAPLGTFGDNRVADVAGRAERWVKGFVADARINRPNQYVEMTLGSRGAKPLTTLLFWTGSRQPLNMVNYTSMRPTEVVDEMVSYSRSSRALRRGRWTVSRTDPQTGEPLQVAMNDWQWRAEATERLARAKSRGTAALDLEVQDLQRELISVIVNRYGLSPTDAARASEGLSTWLSTAQAQVARDGFFWDEANGLTVLDPVTMRQLPSSRLLMPLDDLDWALRQISTTPYARRGRKARGAMRVSANVLDVLFKVFRTNVLFKFGYVPKNSFAEPGVSAILADGSLLAQDGLAKTLKRFEINNDRRLLSMKYGLVDKMPFSAARRDSNAAAALANDYATLSAQLDEIDQHIADLAEASPVTQSKYLSAAQSERRKLAREMTVLERRLSVTAGEWTDVVEVASYSELADRAASLRSALLDDAFPDQAAARLAELQEAAADRLSGVGQQVSLTERIAQLQAKRDELIGRRDDMYLREGRRAAERDLKNPAKNKRRDLQDPDAPDARRAPDWIEQLARVNDSRDMTSLSRDPGRNDATRRIEATIRSIAYLDERIQAAHAALRVSRKAGATADQLTGLTAVEAEEMLQLQALLAARGKVTPEEAETLLASIDAQLDDIRRATQVVAPDAKGKAEALREQLAALDKQRATLTARIAKRRLSRESLAKREFSGEVDYTQRVGGVDYVIPGPFTPGDEFGTAMRAEASADISQAQQLSGGVDPLGLDRSRLIGTRWERLDSGETIHPVDPRYWDELAYVYNRHVMGDDFVKLILAGKSDMDILKWFDRTTEGKNYAAAMGWNREQIMGGPSGSVKARPLDVTSTSKPRIMVFEDGIIAETRRLLKQYFPDPEVRVRILSGEEVTPGELQAAMGARADLSPVYGTGLRLIGNPLARANVAVNNVFDMFWRNLASKPESRFARWTFFGREYDRQMQRSIRLRQDQGLPIEGSDLIAMKRQAEARALKETENTFYNIRRMANPVFAMRYLTAFASAAWNTVYRYFRLAYRRPGTAMVLAWGWENFLNGFGVDEDGNKVERWQDAKNILVSLPADLDIPIDPSLKISVETFNFATQDGSFNPVFSVGVSSVLRYKPELEPWLKKSHPDIHEELFSYGTGTSPTLSVGPVVLDPVTAGYQRRLKSLVFGSLGLSDDDFLQATTLDYKYRLFQWAKDGQQGPMPTMEESAQNARDFYLWNVSISQLFSGVTGISPEGQFYREEWFRIRDKNAGNYAAAQAEMLSLYGDPAYFIMDSTSSSRSSMPATPEALDILRENEPLAEQLLNMSVTNPKMTVDLLFLDEMSYKEEDRSQAIYDAQFNMTLPGDNQPIRSRDIGAEVEREVIKARSWAIWNASVAARDAALLQLGETTLQPTGATADLYVQWERFESDFVADPDNALMVEEKGLVDTGRTEIALRAINTVLRDRKFMETAGASPTWSVVSSYMSELQRVRQEFDLLPDSKTKQEFAAQWDSYVRSMYLPGAGNFAGYYERFLAGRDLSGTQMLERELNYPRFPLKTEVAAP